MGRGIAKARYSEVCFLLTSLHCQLFFPQVTPMSIKSCVKHIARFVFNSFYPRFTKLSCSFFFSTLIIFFLIQLIFECFLCVKLLGLSFPNILEYHCWKLLVSLGGSQISFMPLNIDVKLLVKQPTAPFAALIFHLTKYTQGDGKHIVEKVYDLNLYPCSRSYLETPNYGVSRFKNCSM